ncbi:hypothetical protein LWI29_007909 [Acer saccharum]|uniref:Uncharacterized protein n=1 Tax=Acer saccharum TaxID=4024 RepID=A0AA39V7R3_ACESA|nr:hypothetical protein LWI29_007909 [Acer saccharum]
MGSYYLASYHSSGWLPIREDGKRMKGKLDLPSKEEAQKKNGLIWGMPSSNKYWKGTYTDQPKLNKHEADRVAQAVQTSMESWNFKALVTMGSLKAFGLIPELISDHNHILDLDPILGKMIRALKSVKVISKEDAKTAEKQGIAPPDDPSLAEDYDNEGLNLNTATTGSGVAVIVSTAGSDAPADSSFSHPIGFLRWRRFGSQAPAEATSSLLSELDRLDPSVALRWAMTGELSFGSTEDFEAFNADNMVDQGEKSLHYLTMLLRKCDLAVKDRERLTGQDYESNFETAKTEIGVRAIDLFKHSPAFEAFTHKEFMRGVEACKNLIRSLDHPIVTDQIDESLRVNVQEAEENLKKQIASSQPGNLWLDPLIDYGPDSESEGKEFYEEAFQDEKGDCEKGDQEEEETIAEDFRGDTGANLDEPGKNGKDDDTKD